MLAVCFVKHTVNSSLNQGHCVTYQRIAGKPVYSALAPSGMRREYAPPMSTDIQYEDLKKNHQRRATMRRMYIPDSQTWPKHITDQDYFTETLTTDHTHVLNRDWYQYLSRSQTTEVGLYRISAPAPAGIRHFFQIWQKSGSGKNPTGAG